MKLENLWVLRNPKNGKLLICDEAYDPIALFRSRESAESHAEEYEADDFEPVKLADCLQ